MKRFLYVAAISFFAVEAMSQPTAYEAAKLSGNELNGTARFVGMGGAMSALGGDLSVISTNPAGLAIYRRSDIMISAGFDQHHTSLGDIKEDHTQARLNNIGVVIPFPVHTSKVLSNVNFAFQYQRRNNFYKNMSLNQVLRNGLSQLSQAVAMANGTSVDDIWGDDNYNPFYNEQVGWLPIIGVNTEVVVPGAGGDDSYGAGYLIDEEGNATLPSEASSMFSSNEEGGIDQMDFSFSFNFNDRFYLGASIGYYHVDYTKNTYYEEGVYDDFWDDVLGYYIYSDNWIHGDGVDFKLGGIVRPFEDSPLRIGFAVHTPVFYRLTLTTGFDAGSSFEYVGETGADGFAPVEVTQSTISSYDNMDGYPIDQDFRLRTPWLFNVSAGYTIGTNVALGAEYEYEDYSSCNFKDPVGENYLYGNEQISSQLQGVHTLRIGGEYKVMPELSLRAGYNYSSSAYKEGSYKSLPYNSINTDTEYTNHEAMHQITAGLGVRLTSNTYLDFAYKFLTQKGDFYAFDNEYLAPVSLQEKRHSFIATLGYRF
ncbi:MAG: OmpP1/FadL family transporter [Bacteroidaceae bacterium]|jgi:long-subunit fatty acid transport protein